MDMIETMVNFRPRELWPRRKLKAADAEIANPQLFTMPWQHGVSSSLRNPRRPATTLIEQSVAAALPFFDAASREYAYHRNQEMLRDTGGISPTSMNPTEAPEFGVVHAGGNMWRNWTMS